MLTEREIFDCMKQNLRTAAEDCDTIARFPLSGVAFGRMRRSLKLVEGACRQAAHWREDARWLAPALHMEHAHQIARGWLHRPTIQSKKLFTGLAAALRQILADIHRLETLATDSVGAILTPNVEHNRVSGLSHLARLPSGLIVPQSLQ